MKMRQFEIALIMEALEQVEHNRHKAARILGVGRSTLIMKMKKLGLPLDGEERRRAYLLRRQDAEASRNRGDEGGARE